MYLLFNAYLIALKLNLYILRYVTLQRIQPDVWIHPKNSIILTIRATEMVRSNEYPTGYSLRFPRVMNVRSDKPWYSSCTISELLSLVKVRR